MISYQIEVNSEVSDIIEKNASRLGITPEKVIEQIINKFIVPLHTINQEDMARGYEQMSEINLELANL